LDSKALRPPDLDERSHIFLCLCARLKWRRLLDRQRPGVHGTRS
jgi:hypothetical protein